MLSQYDFEERKNNNNNNKKLKNLNDYNSCSDWSSEQLINRTCARLGDNFRTNVIIKGTT